MAKKTSIGAICMILSSLLFLAACADGPTEGTQERIHKYEEDGYLGMTNANPNLQTSPTYHTYAKDQKLVLATLDDFEDLENARVTFNGARITVHYDLPEEYNAVKAEYLQTELRDKLKYMLPRYDIVMDGPFD